MIKHVFENIESKQLNEWQASHVGKSSKSNGLFNTLATGYAGHVPVMLRPDDILNTVTTLWAKYIIAHSDKFRSFFVQHESKKTLEYKTGGGWSMDRLPEFISGLRELIIADQGQAIEWASQSFSTTTNNDALCRAACILASQKEFYGYRGTMMCGFPSVSLMGTSEDWQLLIDSVSAMPVSNDIELSAWRDSLCSMIESMIQGDEGFWQSCINKETYGSGGQTKFTGWIKILNPFNEKGEWINGKVDDSEILNMTVDFPILMNDNGHEFELMVQTGVDRFEYSDGILSPATNVSAVENALA